MALGKLRAVDLMGAVEGCETVVEGCERGLTTIERDSVHIST